MDIMEKEQEIIKEFSDLSDWTERYKHIIKLGRTLEPLDDKHMIEENLVRGCQSQVWLVTNFEDDNVIFKGESDAAIVKGLVALMIRFYSGEAPETILNTPPMFIKKIGMSQHLSPTRSNGLASMVKQMKIYAMAYKSKQEKEAEKVG